MATKAAVQADRGLGRSMGKILAGHRGQLSLTRGALARNSGAGAGRDSVAYVCTVRETCSLADRAVVADARAVVDHAAGSDPNALVDYDLVADETVRPNGDCIAGQRRPWFLLLRQQSSFLGVPQDAVLAHDTGGSDLNG
jgi:hypothetical protein